MTLEAAVRLAEILLSLALIQQSGEHLRDDGRMRPLFLGRIGLCVLIILGVGAPWALAGLAILSLLILYRFQGPYNGGSDRLGILAVWCLALSYLMPTTAGREVIFGYLGLQVVLSYLIAGAVKIVNPDWRSGRALRDVFQFSAYPVSEDLRRWADRPRAMLAMSWAVMLFELAFPLALLSQGSLVVALVVAGTFHLANACLFGLNRFFWTWIAAYPAIIWLQDRLF